MSSPSNSLLQKLQSKAQALTTLLTRAIQTGTWQYPLKGLLYFTTHRPLWHPLVKYLFPLLALTLLVIAFMFTFTYLPQSLILTLFNGPWAWISTIGLVLAESSAITGILSRQLFLSEGIIQVYDTVLNERGAGHLLQQEKKRQEREREQKERETIRDKVSETTRRRFHPTSIYQEIKHSLMYAPLNFIPIIGPMLFLVIQSHIQAPTYHDRYFYLKGFTEQQKREFIEKNREGYLGFGIVSLSLGMLPVVNVIVSFTNMAGAAMWAADIERGVYISSVGLRKEEERRGENRDGVGSSTGVSSVPVPGKSYAEAAKEPKKF